MSSPRRLRVVTLACALAAAFAVKAAPLAQRSPIILIPAPSAGPAGMSIQSMQGALTHFRSRIAAEGSISLIVEVRTPPMASAAPVDSTDEPTDLGMLRQARQNVIQRLPRGGEPVREYESIPFFALLADATAFDILLSDPNVVSIQEDFAVPPALGESVPLIEGYDAWDMGYLGSNTAVAILDSGVEKSHPRFLKRVISEACYSGGGKKPWSLCRNSALASTAGNSGLPCTWLPSSCSHGTHVAAIAAGTTGVSGASIIAIQVFSKSTDSDGDASLGANTSDIVKALERVYSLRTTYDISAINMSIGGGGYTKTCDSVSPATVAIVKKLHDARIATVVASGNDSYINGISWPGCMSQAVSVGNTTKRDSVNSSSNGASFLRLLAPGTSIYAAVPGGSYGYKTGTSMAAPHVAGAWAILVQRTPSLTVTTGLAALRNSGLNVYDSRNGRTFKRIRIKAALAKIPAAKPATLKTPTVTSTSTKPAYSWTGIAASTHYKLWVEVDGTDKAVINTWYEKKDVCKGTVCSVTPSKTLTKGNTYRWWIRTYDFRSGPWSVSRTFKVGGAP